MQFLGNGRFPDVFGREARGGLACLVVLWTALWGVYIGGPYHIDFGGGGRVVFDGRVV
jgi:hypothetical protein